MTYLNSDCLQTNPIKITAGLAYIEAQKTPQHDAHLKAFRNFQHAYGTREGYFLAMAAKAHTDSILMRNEEGRDFIAKRNAEHAEWRASR